MRQHRIYSGPISCLILLEILAAQQHFDATGGVDQQQ
jgi:hypothetical protein